MFHGVVYSGLESIIDRHSQSFTGGHSLKLSVLTSRTDLKHSFIFVLEELESGFVSQLRSWVLFLQNNSRRNLIAVYRKRSPVHRLHKVELICLVLC